MLNELKNRKRIKDMDIDEQGYLHPGAIIRDEKGGEWLNLNAIVTTDYKVLSKKIKKISNEITGYEITATDIITANADTSMPGSSDILKDGRVPKL